MMTLLRKHRNWMMIVIAILAIPFIFYFNKTDPNRSRPFAHIYGHEVSDLDRHTGRQLAALARELGMQNLMRSLGVGANSETEFYDQFTLNRIVLRHEAERLGIEPSTAEVTDFVRTLRPFRTASGFDPKKYDEFVQTVIPSMGLYEARIEELATDELLLRRVKELVGTGVTVPEAQSKNEYEMLYGKIDASVVRLHAASFAKDVQVSNDDIQKYYESHKAELKTDERRKVEFVNLSLTAEQKKLAGKERIDALQKLADRANDITQALLERGAEFHQVASKFQLPIEATGEFTTTSPDPKLKADPQLTTAAFQLTTQEPNSDAVQAPDGFYVLHLVGIEPARPLSLEEAKPKIVEAIKTSRAGEMVANKGAQVSHDIREALLAGTPLPAALDKSGVKAEKIEPFTLSEDMDPEEMPKEPKKRGPDFTAIRNAVAGMQTGGVTEFIPDGDGGIVAIVEKREVPDPAKFAQKRASFDQRILSNKREIVFYEWLRDRQQEAGIVAPKEKG